MLSRGDHPCALCLGEKDRRNPTRASQVLPLTPQGRKQGSPEGWPAVPGCGESLWDFVLKPPREARGVSE